MSPPTAPAALEATVELRVPFHDVDPAAMAWHGHYPRYLESARCALLEHIGYSYAAMADSGYLWPIVDLGIRYRRPLRYDQSFAVAARLVEWEYRLRIDYRLSDLASGELLAEARTDQIAVNRESGDWLVGSPQVLLDRVAAALASHAVTRDGRNCE